MATRYTFRNENEYLSINRTVTEKPKKGFEEVSGKAAGNVNTSISKIWLNSETLYTDYWKKKIQIDRFEVVVLSCGGELKNVESE